MPDQIEDRVIVDPLLHDGIDLDRREARRLGRRDPGQHFVEVAAIAAHRAEHLAIETVEADRDAVQPGGGQPARDRRQQHRIGRQREVFDAVDLAQASDQIVDVLVQQRFPAGQAQLGDAEPHGDPRDAHDLVVAEPLGAREELIVRVILRRGHAVRAAEVALVQQRDSQVAQRPPETVPGIARRRCRRVAHGVILPESAAGWQAPRGLGVSSPETVPASAARADFL